MQPPKEAINPWTAESADREGKEPHLVVLAGGMRCALALDEVGEVLRPLSLTQVAGAPPEVVGVAIVRGRSVPILRLAELFDGKTSASPKTGRWVTLKDPESPILAVDAVERVRWLDSDKLGRAELLSEAAAGAVQRLGALDRQILVCLETARILEAVDLPGGAVATAADHSPSENAPTDDPEVSS